jgi:tRNA (mo5U34)-methyltransferase
MESPFSPVAPDESQKTWQETKRRKQELSQSFQAGAAKDRLVSAIQVVPDKSEITFEHWIERKVEAEPYWFHKMEVLPGLFSPGWSDAAVEKLPHYGLPQDLTGKRVLDIGCAEGFFSFEAEKRGAREVIAIDSFPDSVRRFNIVKEARRSNATAFLMNVYDLEPSRLGTFDLVLFYGVFYHLKHPQYALERIQSVCTGDLLFQTYMLEEPSLKGIPWARFYPHGMMSGSRNEMFDPTVFWLFNSACCLAMLDHVGFVDLQIISTDPHPFVVSARSATLSPGCPPDQAQAPWS